MLRSHPLTQNPQAGGPTLTSCLQLLIQCIHSYLPYLEDVFSIHNLMTCHVMVTGTHLNMVYVYKHKFVMM